MFIQVFIRCLLCTRNCEIDASEIVRVKREGPVSPRIDGLVVLTQDSGNAKAAESNNVSSISGTWAPDLWDPEKPRTGI